MTKTELRHEFLIKRKKLSDEEAALLSNQIAVRFFQSFDLSHVHYLHLYLPLLRKREINTHILIERIRGRFPQISIVIPKADASSLILESYLLTADSTLFINAWGIPEPEDSTLINPLSIDLIVLPLLAFDKRGYRVGYGKGFYDRYLSRCRPDVVKIGLSFFDPVDWINDADSFDVPMDYCLTPDRLWEFGGTH